MKINKTNVFLMALVLTILPFCYLCFFANPSADDFSLSGHAQQHDFLDLLHYNYFFRNGRYISNIFIFLNPIAFGSFVGYKIASFGMIVLTVFANYIFVGQLLYKKSRQIKFLVALILTSLFIHNMPIVSEGIYWFTGSAIYLLGIIFLLFYLSFLIMTIKRKKKGASFIFLTFLLFLVCGFNEVQALFLVFFFAMASYIFIKKNLIGKQIIATQFLFSIAFAGVMIFAPGNEIRSGAYQDAHNFSHSLIYSLLQVGRFSFIWISSVPLIAASFLYFQFNKNARTENRIIKNSFYINRWVSLLFLFAITFICVFPPYWATGILGQHRTLNVAYFFFLVMWFINLTVWYNYYESKLRFALTNNIKTTLAVFMVAGILFTGNGYNGLIDIFSSSVNNYDRQLTERFQLLEEAKNSKELTVIIPEITAQPISLFVSDISHNSQDWTNQAYNLYFELPNKEIVLEVKGNK